MLVSTKWAVNAKSLTVKDALQPVGLTDVTKRTVDIARTCVLIWCQSVFLRKKKEGSLEHCNVTVQSQTWVLCAQQLFSIHWFDSSSSFLDRKELLTNPKFYSVPHVDTKASLRDRIGAKIRKRYPSCTSLATNGDRRLFEVEDRVWHSLSWLSADRNSRHFHRWSCCSDHHCRLCWKIHFRLCDMEEDRGFLGSRVRVRILRSRIQPC